MRIFRNLSLEIYKFTRILDIHTLVISVFLYCLPENTLYSPHHSVQKGQGNPFKLLRVMTEVELPLQDPGVRPIRKIHASSLSQVHHCFHL